MVILYRFQRTIQQLAQGRIILVLFGISFVILLVLDFTDVPFGVRALAAQAGGLPILDMRSSYTPNEAYALFDALGAQGRQLYATMILVADIILPAAYTLFFATLIAWLVRRLVAPDHIAQRLSFVPFLALVGDWGENICFLTMISFYPTRLDSVAQIANVLTILKSVGLALCALIIIVLLLAVVWRGKRTE